MKTHRENLEMNTPFFYTEEDKLVAEIFYRRGVEFEKSGMRLKQ